MQVIVSSIGEVLRGSETVGPAGHAVGQICQVAGPNVHNTFADLSLCFTFGPTDFHLVWLYSNSPGPNVRHGVSLDIRGATGHIQFACHHIGPQS